MLGMSARLILCALAALLAAMCGPTRASSIKLLDELDSTDVATVAEAVCEDLSGRERQIGRLSTIDKLAAYFEHQVSGDQHKLAECKRRHQNAIELLNELIKTSNQNVCSEDKLALIEDFHNRYVSTHMVHEQSRKESQRDMAPQLLRLLFMHYAMEVNALCKRTLINNLEWDLKQKFGDDVEQRLMELDVQDEDDRNAFSAIFKGAMQKFTDLYSVEKYEDVLMIWDLIENSYLSQKLAAQDEEISDEYDPVTGEPVRLLVRIRSRGYLDKIKQLCHYNFKPIYRKLILPIIKLANLGYSNNGEQFKVELDELRSNEQVKRWYSVTQLCEAMLPVKFYEDPALPSKDVIVMTKKEAAELDKAAGAAPEVDSERKPLEYEPETNSFVGVDMLDSLTSTESQKLVNAIKSNLSVRDRVVGRAIVKMLRNIKNQLKSTTVGRFFFSRDSQKLAHPKSGEHEPHFERQEVGQGLRKSLDSMDESELLKLEGALGSTRVGASKTEVSGVGQRRRRRRKGDVDAIQEMRTQALSHTRTKSWSEIFAGWGPVLSALTPSRTQLIVVGGAVIVMMLLMCFTVLTMSFVAAG